MARTWAAELQRANVAVNAIIPTAMTRMTATVPALAPYVEAYERGEALPDHLRAELGIGGPEDVAPLAVFLASEAGRNVTGQCIGIGGDRLSLWSHPAEIKADISKGGWTADGIAQAWDSLSDGQLQPFGMQLPL